jgi:hypothetical protein
MTTRQYVTPKSSRAMVAAALLLGSAGLAGAQNTQLASADARWTPWVGCWQASSRDVVTQELAPNKAAPVVCVVPVTGSPTVDLVTVTDSKVGPPDRVDANGNRRTVSREGCEGWETADFSPDSKRIYLKSEYKCAGNRTRLSSGLMSITPNGEWLDVQNVKVESNSAVRVVHYGRVPVPALLSADMRAALENGGMSKTIAVMAVADSIRIADVVEASKRVEPLVVQTWLAQRGQGFNLDAKGVAQLADAKVPANVIDVMVALSYPRAFAINLAQADGQIIPTGNAAQANNQEVIGDGPTVYMNWDPFYSSSYGYYNSYYYRGSQLGYGGYYPPYWYYQGRTPVIITRPSGSVDVPAADTRGRMVRGSGYTRPADRADGGSSSGTPRSSTSDGGSRSTGSTSTGSTTSSEPRTAKPRP